MEKIIFESSLLKPQSSLFSNARVLIFASEHAKVLNPTLTYFQKHPNVIFLYSPFLKVHLETRITSAGVIFTELRIFKDFHASRQIAHERIQITN